MSTIECKKDEKKQKKYAFPAKFLKKAYVYNLP